MTFLKLDMRQWTPYQGPFTLTLVDERPRVGGRGQRVSVVGGHTRPGRTWGAAGGLQTGGGGFPPFFKCFIYEHIQE